MEESINAVTAVLWLPSTALSASNFSTRRAEMIAEPSPDSERDHSDHEVTVETPDASKRAVAGEISADELGPEFDMDNYDDEDAEDQAHLFSVVDADLKLLREKDEFMNDEVSDSEDDNYYQIKDDDVLFVAANVEDDACTIEVYLHDTYDGGMYVHHDFLISSYPLSLEYIPSSNSAQSLLAIGAFDPKIDLWELTTHDPIEPVMQLGDGKKKGHTDAVISLHLCPQNQSALASGSADTTVRIWDLNKGVSVNKLTHHTDKVQSVKWHPIEAGILMSAGYDKTVRVSDQRANSNSSAIVQLACDPECTIWSRHSPSLILVSDEKGFISAHDLRKIDSGAIWSIKAHEKGPCTSFTDVFGHSDLLISAGLNGEAKIWKSEKCCVEPTLVFTRALGAGSLFSVSSHNDDASLAVFGASVPVLWNITDSDVVCKTFPALPGADRPAVQFPDEEDENIEELDD